MWTSTCRTAKAFTLEVTDDGVGLEPGARDKPQSFGLRGLGERARTVQGWLDVSSQAGRGTSVIVSVPLAGTAACPNIPGNES